ncbi:MAG: GNAT family N-acetyltransferase [Devosia sp.]
MSFPDTRAIEMAGLKCWPGLEAEWDGGWVRRAAGGYTKRANSVQCFDASDDGEAPQRLVAARRWFDSRNIRPAFRVTPLAGVGVLRALDAAVWASIDHSRLMAMELGPVEADPRGSLQAPLDAGFVEVQRRLQEYDDATTERMRALFGAFTVPARGVIVADGDGRAVAAALVSVDGGIALTSGVVTDPAARRQGFGAAAVRTGLAWAQSVGARFATLNVAAENVAAQALYVRLGFAPHYDYHYRVPQ